jgi:tetratricopeptide (TPR) repeat protein
LIYQHCFIFSAQTMLRSARVLLTRPMVCRPVRHYVRHQTVYNTVPANAPSYSIDYKTIEEHSGNNQLTPKYFLEGLPTMGPIRSMFHKAVYDFNGGLLYDLKRYNEAIESYKKCLGTKDDKTNMYQIACCYGIQGDKTMALSWFLKAHRNGWNDWKHAIVDKDLDCICDEPDFVNAIKAMKNRKSESEIVDEYMKKHSIKN